MIATRALMRCASSTLPAARWLYTSSACLQQSAQVVVSEDRRKLKLVCEGEQERSFHGLWLRHQCRCPACTSVHNNQTVVDGRLLVRDLRVEHADVEGDQVNVRWSVSGNTAHSGSFPVEWLKENDYSNPETNRNNKPLVADSFPVSHYEDVMSSDEGLYHWLLQLNQYGVSLLKNVPTTKFDMVKAVERIGKYAVQPTVYGQTFDVIASDEPTDKAYTSDELLLHMDQGYYESTPGLQFLHCLKFDGCVEGGVSTVLDAYPVVEEMRRRDPKQFDTLTRVPVRFYRSTKLDEQAVELFYEKKIISLNRDGEIVGINWHPQFFSPLHPKDDDELEEFYDAFRLLAEMFDNSKLKLVHRLQPGEALTFNNRRILHTRSAFQLHGGKRTLLGVYVLMDEFRSRFYSLRKQLGKNDSPKMVLNSSTSQ